MQVVAREPAAADPLESEPRTLNQGSKTWRRTPSRVRAATGAARVRAAEGESLWENQSAPGLLFHKTSPAAALTHVHSPSLPPLRSPQRCPLSLAHRTARCFAIASPIGRRPGPARSPLIECFR